MLWVDSSKNLGETNYERFARFTQNTFSLLLMALLSVGSRTEAPEIIMASQ